MVEIKLGWLRKYAGVVNFSCKSVVLLRMIVVYMSSMVIFSCIHLRIEIIIGKEKYLTKEIKSFL